MSLLNLDINTGRIGENIVTNELIIRGFLVTHLDKGTRGVSANADLMCAPRESKRPSHRDSKRPLLIQCKASRTDNFKWMLFATASEAALNKERTFFNSKSGFEADFLVTASILSLKEYRVFVIPIAEAEEIAYKVTNDTHTNADGKRRKASPMVWLPIDKSATHDRSKHRETRLWALNRILSYEDRFDLLSPSGSDQEEGWSPELRERTRTMIQESHMHLIPELLHMKNYDGRMGAINVSDLHNGVLKIANKDFQKQDWEYDTHNSVESLIAAGWAVD